MSTTVPLVSLAAMIEEVRPGLEAALARVLDGGRFIMGPELEAFEAEFAARCGARHAVGTGCGLDALTLALRALDVGPGDEVIVPCHTFIATWLAISAVGASVVPVDVEPGTWTLDVAAVGAAIGPRTRAVVPVHIYGHPADMDPLAALCGDRGIAVIEDAAQAHGALYKGRPAGSLGRAAAFSFYPTKNLAALGDGGAVVTDDGALAARVRRLRNYGADARHAFPERGVNSRLDELQAAFLRVRLERLETWNAERRRIAGRYLEGLAGLPLGLPEVRPWAEPVWHLFVVRSARRDALAQWLAGRGIGTGLHYPVPPHRQGAYRDLGLDPGSVANSEAVAREGLSLPLWPGMTDAMVDRVIAGTRAFFGTRG
jgi:dTDP-4-amino-4,6-dideoxygalactose transaminase